MAEEKTIYVVNNTFITHEICDVTFPRGRFVAINDIKLKELKKNGIFASLLKNKELELRDEIDDSMRTTEEQLANSKVEVDAVRAELAVVSEDRDNIKAEALKAIKERDEKIAELEAQLAAK